MSLLIQAVLNMTNKKKKEIFWEKNSYLNIQIHWFGVKAYPQEFFGGCGGEG